jgi:hypothetical protein
MEIIFEEALGHSRRKTLLKGIIGQLKLNDYRNLTFQQIYSSLYQNYKQFGDIGLLTLYDLTSGICRHFDIPITQIFIIGKGPQRAAKILKLKCKKLTFNGITLKYVDISDVKKVHQLPENLKNTTNGDLIESYLCKWQKSQ